MSWDIFVTDIPKNARAVSDIPRDFEQRPLGARSEVIRRILEVAPDADASNPSWVTVIRPDFSIEFNIGTKEEVTSFALHVRGGDAAAGLVSEFLSRTGWRAFDPASESGLFDPASAAVSLKNWRAYRDRVSAIYSKEVSHLRRPIPGTQDVTDREYMYLESTEGETFNQITSIAKGSPSIVKPRSGGAIEEGVRVKLKTGGSFFGISYKGDIEGWRAMFAGICELSKRQYGFVREGRLVLSDGSSSSVEDMEVSFK